MSARPLTVAELIEELRKYPAYAFIYCDYPVKGPIIDIESTKVGENLYVVLIRERPAA